MTFSRIFSALLILTLAGLACQISETGFAPVPSATQAPATLPLASPLPISDDSAPSAGLPPVDSGGVAPSASALESPVVALPDSIPPQGPGKACFGLRAGGLTCLDENGWQAFTSENSGLPSNFLQAASLCPDGRIALAHSRGLSLFDGRTWENIPETKNYSTAESVACAPDGSLWVAHFKGISVYAQGRWTTYPAAMLASGESATELVYDLAALPDGRIWAVTARSLAVFENSKWQVFQQGSGFEESVFARALTIDSRNRPWVSLSQGIAVYDGEWQMLPKPGYATVHALTFDADGRLWVGMVGDGLSLFNGSAWIEFNRKLGNFPSDSIQDIVADSLGRVWVATSYGLVVFAEQDQQVYRMDNSGIGDNELRFVVVIKDGPSLPSLEPRETGSLTGKLESDSGAIMAEKRVEICVESLSGQFSGDTPCAGQPFVLSTTTNAGGVFLFENVPAGYYVLAAETDSGWAQLTTEFGIGSERTLVLPGQAVDMGLLTLQAE